MQKDPTIVLLFGQLGAFSAVDDDMVAVVECLVCAMYGKPSYTMQTSFDQVNNCQCTI